MLIMILVKAIPIRVAARSWHSKTDYSKANNVFHYLLGPVNENLSLLLSKKKITDKNDSLHTVCGC